MARKLGLRALMTLTVLVGVVGFAVPAWAAQSPKPPRHATNAGPPGPVGPPSGLGPLGLPGAGPLGDLVGGLDDVLPPLVDGIGELVDPGDGSGGSGGGGSVGGGVSGGTPPSTPAPSSGPVPTPPATPVPAPVASPGPAPTNAAPTASSGPASLGSNARANVAAQGPDSPAPQGGLASGTPSEAPVSSGDAPGSTETLGTPLIVDTPRGVWLVLGVALALLAGMGIRHVTMRRQIDAARRFATRDPLTGLANRRLFDESLAREVARQKRHGGTLAIAVIDLDHFKAVNDTRGHAGGDAVLRQVAGAIDARVRGSDLPARIGGDEFAVLLPECAPTAANRVAEALRTAIDDTVGPVVTASVGIAVMPDHADDADSLLAAADAALYAAKSDGRNRVACVS